jgi:hypothetical protein
MWALMPIFRILWMSIAIWIFHLFVESNAVFRRLMENAYSLRSIVKAFD